MSTGVPDGEAMAREAVLEVQLAFAATLVASATASVWYALDVLRTAGTDSVAALLGALLAVVAAQLYVLDHTWFLVLRGAWLASVLVARQDQRNLIDPAYLERLETLYDVGSVRFHRGLANALEAAVAIAALGGAWEGALGAGWLRVGAAAGAMVAAAWLFDRTALAGRVGAWRDRVRPALRAVERRLGLPWVDPPYGDAHRVPWVERGLRVAVGAVLVVVNLQWVLVSALVPEREIVHRGDEVVLRFHLGGLRPSEASVAVTLTSDTVDQALLDRGTTWMGDGLLVVIPTDALAEGRHEVAAAVAVRQAHASVSIGLGEPATFVVRP